MTALLSGLPEQVDDQEELSRFLTQSNQYGANGAKAAAFLPNPRHRNTSVFRGPDLVTLRRTFEAARTDGRKAKAVAVMRAQAVRGAGLDVVASEPPPAHANIEGWPWIEGDPDFQKAQQLELAVRMAAASWLVPL